MKLCVNGRFLSRSTTGVERVALEMLKAIEEVLRACGREPSSYMRIIMPLCKKLPEPNCFNSHLQQGGYLSGQFWEQIELPLYSRNNWLYNPCNLGPLITSNSIITIHDAQVYLTPESYSHTFRFWYKAILPILGRRARIVTTVSNFSKTMLEHYRVVPPGKIHVIPNGADHVHRIEADKTFLSRHGLTKDGYILAIGSLSPHKNIKIVIEAISLRQDRVHPLVVAGGEATAHVFADADLPDNKDVIYLGRVSDAELKALYENALCLVFPSLFEGFGLPVLEAMACGCPGIASNTSAIPEVCAEAVLYADPNDAQAWADRMDQIVSQLDLRERLRQAGIKRAASFTWFNAAIKLLRLVAHEDGDTQLIQELDCINADAPGMLEYVHHKVGNKVGKGVVAL